MKKVCLQFPNLYILWEFAHTPTSNSIEINTNKRTLICDCTDEHIAQAIKKYRGKVIELNTSEK